jgi:sec-independent protein translocase protein TatB
MFDIGATELLIIAIVAVLVIGPKDMPLAMRTAGRWIGKVRKISGHFRAGLESMIREAEMEEMEKKWAEQNKKIMAEHPADAPPEMEPTGAYPSKTAAAAEARAVEEQPADSPAAPPVPADEPQLPLGKPD